MAILVEPFEGAELERLITALLNATGAVQQVIGQALEGGGPGVEVIGRSAERLRAILAVVAEHHGDEELRVITEFLAIATMLIAEEEGFADDFQRGDDDVGGLHADWV
ncbi:MAG: hypothetical protein KJ006_12370 [Thermoleophilia bacterium]|nr:hypothetical protein [Thermoleophilia bacterium]